MELAKIGCIRTKQIGKQQGAVIFEYTMYNTRHSTMRIPFIIIGKEVSVQLQIHFFPCKLKSVRQHPAWNFLLFFPLSFLVSKIVEDVAGG
jgi:hypothetical protein